MGDISDRVIAITQEGGFYFDSPDRMLSTWRCLYWTTFPCRLGQTPGRTHSLVNSAPNLLLSVFAAFVASEETVINFDKSRLRRKLHLLLRGKGERIFSPTCLEQSRAEDVLIYDQIYQQVGEPKLKPYLEKMIRVSPSSFHLMVMKLKSPWIAFIKRTQEFGSVCGSV